MAQHNLNNIIVDRVLRGIFSDKNDNIIFSLNQVQNLSLNQTSESQEVTDALGVSIMELMRAKALEASAENAIYDFGLLAAQYGTEKVEGSADAKIVTPAMETFEAVGETYALKHTPVKAPTAIYALNGDSTLGEKYVAGTQASATEFAYADGVITLPTGLEANTEMFVMYEYETENAIEVVNSANNFAKMGKMTFEILAYDVCDPEVKLFGYLILDRFQLSNDFDWSIGGDSQTHAFSGKAHVDYCSKNKRMCRVVIVDDEE
jgi:hypothetical protein